MDLSTIHAKDCEFSIKTANALQRFRSTLPLATLDRMNDDDILRIPGIGRKGLSEIREAITNARQHQPSAPEALREIAEIVIGDPVVSVGEIVEAVRRLKAERDTLLEREIDPDEDVSGMRMG